MSRSLELSHHCYRPSLTSLEASNLLYVSSLLTNDTSDMADAPASKLTDALSRLSPHLQSDAGTFRRSSANAHMS